MPVAYSSSIIARSRRPSGVVDVGLRDERVHFLERQELRQRGPGARRLKVVGRAAARAGDRARGSGSTRESRRPIARRTAATARGDLLADELLRAPGDRATSGVASEAGRVRRERSQIAPVAFEGVRGQPPLDAQMVEKRIDAGGAAVARSQGTVCPLTWCLPPSGSHRLPVEPMIRCAACS